MTALSSTSNKGQRLPERFEEALIASGLVDEVDDLQSLDPRPYRFIEGDFVCHRGDQANCLWVIVDGAVAVRDERHSLFVRNRHEVVGEQNLLGNGCQRWYDLAISERNAELLRIDKGAIESHPQADLLWRNIAKIISLKLKKATLRNLELGHQIEDDTRIMRAYTNEYALARRSQFAGVQSADHKPENAVIWFSDVVNFSGYVLELEPERTADIVQRFFNAQSTPIEQRGGHIDKFMGDGLMAFWIAGGEEEADTVCDNALKAAEEAIAGVSRVTVGRHPLQLRVGLHFGSVLTGDFGSANRHQFTLIGREVNKAARLEQIDAADIVAGGSHLGHVRLSPEFHDRLSSPDSARYNKKVRAKGKHIGELDVFVDPKDKAP